MHMRAINAHETEAIVEAGGSIHIAGLPFAKGDRVRILVLPEDAPLIHSPEEIEQSRIIRQSLQGSVIRYERPNDPVGVEDWNGLRDDDSNK